ncbi:putative ABC transport system permease protein [Flavobacterium omnivorum]|uniref:Putative ABC transport system permease protein n=1 Tax=Flavobacterium omnivorum TaxID=178355 RepID=A0A1G8A128_9FLAO|nr:ABC transporter permease [Flavobacterium omnivorum]SDH14644.1 putative ABC transport system permease protein [Flavobacterium omnivorum]
MLKNWTRIFLYHLKNEKLFSALNVFGLAIGIAGLIFALLYWNDEQSYDAWNPEKDKVFKVFTDIGKNVIWPYNPVTLETYLKDNPSVANVVYHDGYHADFFKYKEKKHFINKTLNTQNDFFELFPFERVAGNLSTALLKENSVAMNQETAKLFFKEENPIGKQIIYENTILTVTAVYKVPGNSSINPTMVINQMKEQLLENKDYWGNFYYHLMIKLKDPTKAEEITKKINELYYQNKTVKDAKSDGMSVEEYIKSYGSIKSVLNPLSTIRLHAIVPGMPEGQGNYQFLVIMLGLSVLIIILSIANYINLATANAIKRAKEVGIRKIIGASKMNIVCQFIFESILINLFSIFLALVIVELSLPFYNEFLEKELIIYGSQFYIQLILIFIITVSVAGVFPAVYVANFETLKVLKGNFGRSKSGIWMRNGMLILQFAIASFFIVGSYIVYDQVTYLANKDLGFKGDQVVAIRWFKSKDIATHKNANQLIFKKYQTIKSEIVKIQGIQQISTGTFKFGGGNDSSSSFSYNGENIQANNLAIDYNMLDMMQIKIKEGRNISEKLASDSINSMLINETALSMMKEKNPIGKAVLWQGKKLKIIGVVKDFNLLSPQSKVPPMVFFHLKTNDWLLGNLNNIYVKIDANNSGQTLAKIEEFWKENVDQEYPFEYDFVDKEYARTYETYVKQKNLFSLLNIVVIGIALFGLFALASYSIQSRMKEIAIRKTLGAETNTLLKELSKQYILYCAIGFLIALFPVYYLLNKWLENFAFRIDITVFPFIFGFLILLVLTLIIVLLKAYTATRVNVLHYLKYE